MTHELRALVPGTLVAFVHPAWMDEEDYPEVGMVIRFAFRTGRLWILWSDGPNELEYATYETCELSWLATL